MIEILIGVLVYMVTGFFVTLYQLRHEGGDPAERFAVCMGGALAWPLGTLMIVGEAIVSKVTSFSKRKCNDDTLTTLNANSMVRIRLTAQGRRILLENQISLRKYAPIPEHPMYPIDTDGYCEFQLWHVMQLFGPHLSFGSELPFDMNMILKKSDLSTFH